MKNEDLKKDVLCFIISLKKASFDKKHITISGGEFPPETLKEVARLLEETIK